MARSIAGLQGIVPPVVTPLTNDFAVDYPSFTRVIELEPRGAMELLRVFMPASGYAYRDAALSPHELTSLIA